MAESQEIILVITCIDLGAFAEKKSAASRAAERERPSIAS